MIRAFIVTFAEILAQDTLSLRPIDYDNDAKRAGLERDAKKLRDRALSLNVRAATLEAQASTLSPNRTYLTQESE